MSLLTLAGPDSMVLWRVSFAMFAALGAVGLALIGARVGAAGRGGALAGWAHWLAVILYAAVALIAVLAAPIASSLAVAPLQVEAVLLSVLLLVGLDTAVGQLFQTGREQPASKERYER